jgi:hypothetical protein
MSSFFPYADLWARRQQPQIEEGFPCFQPTMLVDCSADCLMGLKEYKEFLIQFHYQSSEDTECSLEIGDTGYNGRNEQNIND